jgi:Zn-dependent protease
LHDRWPDRPYLWAALAGLASVETVSLVLTLLPIPPLDGFHIVAYWLPDDVRASARQLGWMPVIALYVLLSQDSPISDAFWSFGYGLGDILQIPRWFAWYGLDQLRL